MSNNKPTDAKPRSDWKRYKAARNASSRRWLTTERGREFRRRVDARKSRQRVAKYYQTPLTADDFRFESVIDHPLSFFDVWRWLLHNGFSLKAVRQNLGAIVLAADIPQGLVPEDFKDGFALIFDRTRHSSHHFSGYGLLFALNQESKIVVIAFSSQSHRSELLKFLNDRRKNSESTPVLFDRLK